MRLLVTALVALSVAGTASAQFGPPPSNPVAQIEGVEVRKLADIPNSGGRHPIRIAEDPTDRALYVLATSQADGRDNGSTNRVYRLDATSAGGFNLVTVLEDDDHGTPRPVGMAFGPDGSLYLVGNAEVGSDRTQIVIRRGTPADDGWDWATVATSEPYLFSYTYFDHRANSIVVTPDGSTLIVNSGSRSDHGEMYGGVREEGLTSVLLKVPADATDLTLPNDRQALKDAGYVYAEGNRNTADLTFAPNGDLFGPDNAGDRDDPGELNWLREGEHYGFPWRIGGNDTPMQYEGYVPANDPLVPDPCGTPDPADTGCYFSNDPTYPARPEGVTFVEPIPNAGPYADKFLDPVTGAVRDASDEGTSISTFSGGRSPLGLVFDADSLLAGRLEGGAFVLSFAGARGGFPEDGQDLVFLALDKGEDGYTLSAEAAVTGFTHPIDAVMVENVVYVVEYGDWFSNRGTRGVWAVTLPRTGGTASEPLSLSGPRLTAFPNPSAGALTLAYSVPPGAAVRAEVVDVLGRVVWSAEADAPEGRLAVDTSALPAGAYVARVTSGTVRQSRPVTIVR